jgi:hypothetical protein
MIVEDELYDSFYEVIIVEDERYDSFYDQGWQFHGELVEPEPWATLFAQFPYEFD